MRLLNARTYELQTFLGKNKPNYAILSHTWEDGEVLFEDIQNTSRVDWTAKKGYFKIRKTCDQALEDGCDFVWIDTCNINKDSSSELSEAINSMFRWYKDATICYAYISDIKIGDEWSFSKCRWLTRGWTLQEMIAPDRVHFYDADWSFLGSRISLANELSGVSGIQKSVLLRRNYTERLASYSTEENCSCCKKQGDIDASFMLERFSVAQKMKWASDRTTTREEDVAYSLMGLFDVNMPLLYGEGTRAFFRLQKAILEMRPDHSILAFRFNLPNMNGGDCPRFLAPNPTAFCDDFQSIPSSTLVKDASLLGTTLSIDMLLCPVQGGAVFPKPYLGILDCSMADDSHARPAILLFAIDHEVRKTFHCTSYTNNLYLLHSSHLGVARAMTADIQTKLADRAVLSYKPRDIERVRISIFGGDVVMGTRALHSATRYVQIHISSVFRDLGYKYASSLPLTEQHMIFATYPPGAIEIVHERAGKLKVHWDRHNGLLYFNIASFSSPPNEHTTQKQTALRCQTDSWSINDSVTTSHSELGKSKSIVIEGPRTTTLEVWISISNETFIGRSRLALAVHGKIKKPESDRKGKAGLITGLLGT